MLNLDASIVVSTYAHKVNKVLSNRSSALEAEVIEREKIEEELKKQVRQAEQFNKMAIDRELRMIEMKKEIDELLIRLGEEKRYD
jgi:predicted RNase H-like nuclease (RuvC/YqgF family)